MQKLFTVLFTFAILLSACASLTSKAPFGNTPTSIATQIPCTGAATEIPPTPGPKIYTLRMEFSTTSDWSRLTILDSGIVNNVHLVDKQGNFEDYSVDKQTILISQPTDPVLNNPNIEIKITVDFEVADNRSNTSIPFLLEKGAVNNTTIKFFKVLDGKADLLLDDIVREGSVEGYADTNPYNFTFDLKSLFQDVAALPAPTTIPTLSLPVSQNTPVPSASTKIAVENVKDLREIARYYGSVDYLAQLTKDRQFLFVEDGDGVDKYAYPAMTNLAHVAIPVILAYGDDFRFRPELYLQITDDGGWALINNRWLVNLRENSQPKILDLLAEFPLKNLYIRASSLAPNGSFLMISDRRCSDTCIWDKAKIISLSDGSKKDVPSLYGFSPAISPNGEYVAFTTEVAINIWRTPDFKKISTLKIDLPYSVGNIAFSEDGSLASIGQKTNVKIYDVQTGDLQTTIQGLCDTYQRRVIFASNSPVRVVESSDCDSGIWEINSGSATQIQSGGNLDLSKIDIDEQGDVVSIPYPHPVSMLRPYRRQYYFQFLENKTLASKNFDVHSLDRPSCTLSLTGSFINCSNNTETSVGNQFLGSDRILGTDGQYYRYYIESSTVKIYRADNQNQPYYSLPWQGIIFDLEALDPVNKLIFYRIAFDANNGEEVIRDTENNRNLTTFAGQTFFAPIAFSKNKKYAAICQKISYAYRPFQDKLMVFDLAKKKAVYSTRFTCDTTGGSLTLSNDGSKLATEYVSSFSGDTAYVQVLLLDIANGFKSQRFDIETNRAFATAFTPDGDMLAVICQEDTICFLSSSDGQEIYRLRAHSGITHIAFSKDGNLMAASSDWGLISLWAVPPLISTPNQ